MLFLFTNKQKICKNQERIQKASDFSFRKVPGSVATCQACGLLKIKQNVVTVLTIWSLSMYGAGGAESTLVLYRCPRLAIATTLGGQLLRGVGYPPVAGTNTRALTDPSSDSATALNVPCFGFNRAQLVFSTRKQVGVRACWGRCHRGDIHVRYVALPQSSARAPCEAHLLMFPQVVCFWPPISAILGQE